MSREAEIRAAGANLRRNVADVYRDHGDAIGLRICRRYTWELGQLMTEVNGARLASETIYGVADAIAASMPLPDLHADMSVPGKSADQKGPSPSPPANRRRTIEATAWGLLWLAVAWFCGWSMHL